MVDDDHSAGFGPRTYKPERAASPQRSEAEAALSGLPGVVGLGEGQDANGAPTWIVYCQDAQSAKSLPARVAQRAVAPVVSGVIKAQ